MSSVAVSTLHRVQVRVEAVPRELLEPQRWNIAIVDIKWNGVNERIRDARVRKQLLD